MTAPFARRDAGDLATTVRLGWSWTLVELRLFFRVPMQAVFTFALPILFLVIFASLFSGDIDAGPGRRLSFVQYFLPGIIAAGTVSTTFANLAMSIAVQQHEGLLKRLGGTPFPRASYFIGKCSEAVIITALQTALMLTIAVLAYGADLPVSAGRWAGFVAFLLASAATGSVLGIAYTRAIPGATAGPALVALSGVTKTYGSGSAAFRALRGVTLDISGGEFTAVMGPSGCGKSTVMNIIGCLDQPTSGSYRFRGVEITGLTRDQRARLRRRHIGFVFQGFNLLARTSAQENVERRSDRLAARKS